LFASIADVRNERWWQGSSDVAGKILEGKEVPLLGHDILRVADGRCAERRIAAWAGM
jgi:hypothetical protein